MVGQEFWGLLLANAIRALIVEAADATGVDPDRLSFLRTLNIVRRQITNQAAFPPRTLRRATAGALAEILERVRKGRRYRRYPRVFKKGNRHSYPTKLADHRGLTTSSN